MNIEKVDTIYQGVSCVMTVINDTFFIYGDRIFITVGTADGGEDEIEVVGELDTSPSYITNHEDGYICCNICHHAEIYDDNLLGVCSACADNRVEDGMWTEELRDNEDLRTHEDGHIKVNSTSVYKIVGETSIHELHTILTRTAQYFIVQYNDKYGLGISGSDLPVRIAVSSAHFFICS